MQAALDGTHRSATRGWFRDVALRGIDFGAGRWHRRGIEGRPDVLLERVAALLYTQKYESTDRAAALLSVLSAFSEYSSTPPTGWKGGGGGDRDSFDSKHSAADPLVAQFAVLCRAIRDLRDKRARERTIVLCRTGRGWFLPPPVVVTIDFQRRRSYSIKLRRLQGHFLWFVSKSTFHNSYKYLYTPPAGKKFQRRTLERCVKRVNIRLCKKKKLSYYSCY